MTPLIILLALHADPKIEVDRVDGLAVSCRLGSPPAPTSETSYVVIELANSSTEAIRVLNGQVILSIGRSRAHEFQPTFHDWSGPQNRAFEIAPRSERIIVLPFSNRDVLTL